MRAPRAGWRLAWVMLHVLHGAGVVAARWPWLDDAGRHARIGWWSAKLLRLLGIALEVRGQFRPGPALLVANHVSWLDILAIHAVCPRARFVSKAEVRRWPLLGWLIGAVGTLFIERDRKRDALKVVHAIAGALERGQTVAVFPEGTTGDGHSLLPFHGNLLQAAIATRTPVQPVALRFCEPGHATSPTVCWTGATTLAHSVWAIAGGSGIVVRLAALPPLDSAHAERRALADRLRNQIGRALDEARAGEPG